MSYRPRLHKFPRSIVLGKHLNNKYCKVCGEYIEGLKYTGDPYPLHAHTSRYYYAPKETKYLKIRSYYATHLYKKQFPSHHVTIKKYDECLHGDIPLPFEIIFQKKVHYILMLDNSGSMSGQPWKDLIIAVSDFISHLEGNYDLKRNSWLTEISFS